MRLRNKQAAAFTLLELLVALALMNMIALSLYASLYIASRAKRSVTNAMRPHQAVSTVLEPLRRDLQAAVPPTGILAGGFYGESLSSGKDRDTDILEFCCASYCPQADEISSNIVRVAYELTVDDLRHETVLIRRTTINLLSSKVTSPARQEVIGRRIRSFNVRYFDGYAWLDSWDSTTMDNQLPIAVEFTIIADLTPTAEVEQKRYQNDVNQREEQKAVCRAVYLLPCAQPVVM